MDRSQFDAEALVRLEMACPSRCRAARHAAHSSAHRSIRSSSGWVCNQSDEDKDPPEGLLPDVAQPARMAPKRVSVTVANDTTAAHSAIAERHRRAVSGPRPALTSADTSMVSTTAEPPGLYPAQPPRSVALRHARQ